MKFNILLYILWFGLMLFFVLHAKYQKPDPISQELIEIKMKQDSFMMVQKHTDSLIQLQVDSAYAILEDLNTQKSHSDAHTLTLKSRIESIKKQRTNYLNNLPK